MSHIPTVLKSDRSVFDKMLPVDDNGSLVLLIVCAGTAQRINLSAKAHYDRKVRFVSIRGVHYPKHCVKKSSKH